MATAYTSLNRATLFFQALNGEPQIEYSAVDLRRMLGSVWPRAGLIGSNSFRVTAKAQPNWSVDVSAGTAVIGPTGVSHWFRYLVGVTEAVNVPLTGFNTAPSATRTHKVWISVLDNSPTYDGRILVTEDLGSGAPAPAATEGTYNLQIGSFTIGPSQAYVAAANITQSLSMADTALADTTGFTLRAGTVQWGSNTIKVTMRGRRISMSGAVRNNDNSAFIDGEGLLQLDAVYRHTDSSTKQLIAAGNAAPVRISVTNDGWLGYWRQPILNSSNVEVPNIIIYLDGLAWDI